jgi:hypothetical protein
MIEPQTVHKQSYHALTTDTLETHFPAELKPHFVEESSGLHKEQHKVTSHRSDLINASKVIEENDNEAEQEYIEDNFEDDYA